MPFKEDMADNFLQLFNFDLNVIGSRLSADGNQVVRATDHPCCAQANASVFVIERVQIVAEPSDAEGNADKSDSAEAA